MTQLIMHPHARQQLSSLYDALPQSLLLSADRGVGLLTIARQLASDSIAAEIYPLDSKGQKDSENGTIAIDIIRRLYEQTRAKHTKRQVIIIDDAERMSRGAQAAFLKLLEEPNSHVHFILTSHMPEKLLSTIRSRVQHLFLRPATRQQTLDFIATLGVSDKTKCAQLLFIAEGLPAEVCRLVANDTYFQERAAVMGDARQLLQAEPYQKLLILHKYQSSKVAALQLIDSTMLVAKRSLSAKPQTGLMQQLEKLLSIRENVAANHNVRLQLMRFVL